ncbi:hypothetical protein HDV03_005234 [Kappamyces sp. JEL0829]
MSTPLKVSLVLSSVRPGRLNARVAKLLESSMKSLGWIVHVVDPMELKLPLIEATYFSSQVAEGELKTKLAGISALFQDSDAFVICSAEYNNSIPPALSNLLCYFRAEYQYKPSGIACYSMGSFGGVRAAMALRPFLCELGTPSIPALLPFPAAHQSIAEDGSTHDERLLKSVASFLRQLSFYAKACRAQRLADGL